MTTQTFELLEVENGKPIKMWTRGVPVEPEARQQLMNTAQMPFVFKHMAVMPDVHLGKGSTIGSVIPTKGAVIPAAVGVDLGCGMSAVRTSLRASDLPDHLFGLRSAIEKAVPHGRTSGRSGRDKGAWDTAPAIVDQAWSALEGRFDLITQKHPGLEKSNNHKHLGTLGTGNHFVEVCLDEADHVWVMLHTGSRGVGNAIGSYFIEKAREEMRRHMVNLPDRDLAYLREGTSSFDDYVEAVEWAQDFAKQNRAVMMLAVLDAVRSVITKPFESRLIAVDCHHNYVERGTYFGEDILLTRKGAVSAQKGQMGIIPGSMGAKSFIVRGLGNEEAFCSCSHGAGRVMSRTKAKAVFTVEDQVRATAHVECRKDAAVIDEIPMAYKDIDAVMAAQRDLVEVVHTLRQVVCVKG
ncbi:RtcB family protein [Pseudomonas mediterranea]|uniref:RtcB family protein n=1 Tax=Pseudomonas mediterranea TaxID=183795 RepID=UPI0006D8AEE5|nr:RtcB family protein [Pseudomonas mediterranea]MBL0844255.1 RtcB family protein [Pseudomonas mediterranea]QHA82296.1 RtcB family protein [Pseudomonas mediterranea]UZE03126.1 RtcB family protein [Pseudomonas mediterranea]CAH0129671.1 RNA-splicing ligase RtcB [Pseudomonas mediterranea]